MIVGHTSMRQWRSKVAIYVEYLLLWQLDKIHCAAFRLSLSVLYHYWNMRRYFYTLVHILGCTLFYFVCLKYGYKWVCIAALKFKKNRVTNIKHVPTTSIEMYIFLLHNRMLKVIYYIQIYYFGLSLLWFLFYFMMT